LLATAKVEDEPGGEYRARCREDDRDPAGGRRRRRRGAADEAGRSHGCEGEAPSRAADRALDLGRAEEVDLELRAGTSARRPLDRLDEPRQAELHLLPLVEEPLRVGLPAQAVADVAREVIADDAERIERRVELRDCELHLSERLPAERERRGQPDAVQARDPD